MKINIELIRAERIRKGYSQEFIAECLGLSQAKYSRFENGRIHIDTSTLGKLLDILEINLFQAIELSDMQQIFLDAHHNDKYRKDKSNDDEQYLRQIIKEELKNWQK